MPSAISEKIHTETARAAEIISKGGIILYPTDTIWGIGCDASCSAAIERIFRLKNRPENKSLIALVGSQEELLRHVKDIPPLAFDLMDCAIRPMTIIYDHVTGIAENALAQDGSMGIRVVNDVFCRTLINRIKKPLISTSANISGCPSPMCFSDISQEIKDGVDYIADWRREEKSAPAASTIIKLTGDSRITVIRK